MPTYYVDSNATGAGTGADWANAFTTLAAADAVDAAGDSIYVADDHSESTAGALTFSWAGTTASPTRVICADKTSGEPPTTISTGAVVATTGVNNINVNSTGVAYVYGITYRCGDGASNVQPQSVGSGFTVADNCRFEIPATSASARWRINNNANGTAIHRNCIWKFGATGQGWLQNGTGNAWLIGGSIDGAGSAITSLFPSSINYNSDIYIDGFDLSSCATALTFLTPAANFNSHLYLRNCKLPASWSGTLSSSALVRAQSVTMHNCAAGDVNYAYGYKTNTGEISHETTLVRTGGASDGTTPISWEMASTADTDFPFQPLKSGEIVRWNETVGSAITVTVSILHDSATNLKNTEVALKVMYLGTSGVPLGGHLSDAGGASASIPFGDVLNTGSDQTADSSATWTTTGMTNPNKQKLSVTITPQEKGFLIAEVYLYKPSYTVYVDPLLQIS